jgi:hypothetical protein
MAYIPSGEMPYFLKGFIFILVTWCILYIITRIYPISRVAITKTANTRDLGLFILNLIIVAIGISVSVDAFATSMRGDKMSEQELASLSASAQGLMHMVYFLVGCVAAAIFVWIIHVIMIIVNEERKKGKPSSSSEPIIISKEKMDKSTKEIQSNINALNLLQNYNDKIKTIVTNPPNEQQNDKEQKDGKS